MIIIEKMNEMVASIKTQIDFATNELLRCPQGSLSYENKRGKLVIYCETYNKSPQGTRRIRRRNNITGDDETIGLLLRRKYLEHQLKVLEHNLETISRAIEKIDKTDETAILRKFIKKYEWVSGNQLDIAVRSAEASVYDWSSSPLNENLFMEGELKHYTSWGLKVRSKSELLIAEMLHNYGISFKYEVPIVCNGHSLTPDFQIKRMDGKIFWWEHRGLMNNTDYAQRQYQKNLLYCSADIVPWDNLIVTYDNGEGEINLKIVEAEIKSKIMI